MSYSSYPLKYYIFEKIILMMPKRKLMYDNNWFKNMNGHWINNHFQLLSKEEYKKLSLSELKERIGV